MTRSGSEQTADVIGRLLVRVYEIHARVLEKGGGGIEGLRDASMLHAAVARPFSTFAGAELYRTDFDKDFNDPEWDGEPEEPEPVAPRPSPEDVLEPTGTYDDPPDLPRKPKKVKIKLARHHVLDGAFFAGEHEIVVMDETGLSVHRRLAVRSRSG